MSQSISKKRTCGAVDITRSTGGLNVAFNGRNIERQPGCFGIMLDDLAGKRERSFVLLRQGGQCRTGQHVSETLR